MNFWKVAAVVLVAVCVGVRAQAPVFEHSMDVDKKSAECEVCQAIIYEMAKVLLPSKVSKKGREVEVFQALDKICDIEKFRTYEFAPPTMIKTCHVILGKLEEKIESAFIKSNDQVEVRKQVCLGSGVCKALWSPDQVAKVRGDGGQVTEGDDEGGHAAILKAREALATGEASDQLKAAYKGEELNPAAAAPAVDVDENGVPYDGVDASAAAAAAAKKDEL